MHKKLPTKRQLEHWLFDKRPENVDKSPLRKVSPEGLKRFLDLSGVNHQAGYYQYSNETALSGIFENSTLHLSLGRRMNDKVEFRNCNPERWGRTYVASFSFGTSEQIGMWAVYGRPPGNAVRIAFPKTAMLSIREAATHVENLRIAVRSRKTEGGYSYRPFPVSTGIEEVSLHDVIYQYGRESMSEDGSVRPGTILWNRRMGLASRCAAFADCARCPTLATYVKDVLWSGENEVRLVITLDRPVPFAGTIAVRFPRKILDGISVVLGPMTRSPDRTVARIGRRCPGVSITDSAFRAVYH